MNDAQNTIKPKKIQKGSHIRVIAPSRSLSLLSKETLEDAKKRFQEHGFSLSFGRHVEEMDEFLSSSVESRVEDLHEAFSDPNVDAILTTIGGYNSNQMLDSIDYDLIKMHPKIICGFSDVTALANAITAKTGLITYIGPHFSSWAMKYGFEYSLEKFLDCCASDAAFNLQSSEKWSDDPWYIDQEKREFIDNDGYWILNAGYAFGKTIGGHVRCLNALQGTVYWPGFDDSILLLEEDAEINPQLFDRQLQSLIHQKDFHFVKGILIGRFQKETKMTRALLEKIIQSKKALSTLPVIANIDFGHTTPIATLPVGGSIEMIAENEKATIRIIEH